MNCVNCGDPLPGLRVGSLVVAKKAQIIETAIWLRPTLLRLRPSSDQWFFSSLV